MTRNPSLSTYPTHVQTVVHLTPATLASAAKSARIAGRSFERWLAEAIELSASVMDAEVDAPWDEASMRLFAAVASGSPGLFEGRWRRLYDLVAADSSLWRATPVTMGDIEDGLVALEPPVVDESQLARRWAELVTEAFCR
jgi:hypothetical protein